MYHSSVIVLYYQKISYLYLTFKIIEFFQRRAPFTGNFGLELNCKQMYFNAVLVDCKSQTTF